MNDSDSSQDRAETLAMVLIHGDLSKLTSEQKVSHLNRVCESLGLNPLTRPFEYLKINGKQVLYAKRDATDQLRKIHNVSIKIVARETQNNVYIVTAQATLPTGRADESIGALQIGNLKGDALANAIMIAETKAKRRVTLSICGLGFLDETEVESIPGAQTAMENETTPKKIEIYKIPMGRFKGKSLSEVPPADLATSILEVKEWAKSQKLEIPWAIEFIDRANTFLKEEVSQD